MTGTEFRTVMTNDANTKIGDTVIFRWTLCGNQYQCRATITKINNKSFTGTLNHPVGEYPVGWKINVPRITDWKKWSVNNCCVKE